MLDSLKFRKRFLNRLRPKTIGDRSERQRFVMVRADYRSIRAMTPRLAPGAVVLLDRHYNSLRPYQRGAPNLYGVRLKTSASYARWRWRRAASFFGRRTSSGRWDWSKLLSAKASPDTSLDGCATSPSKPDAVGVAHLAQ